MMTRGRAADTPKELPLTGWKDIAFRVKDQIAEDRVSLIAAGVAFYGFLAFFPAIGAIMAISGLFAEPAQVTDQINKLSGIMPQEVMSIVVDQAVSVAGSNDGGLGLAAAFGIMLALYSASKGMGSLIQGLNVAYGENEQRGFIRLKLVTLALTLLLVFGLLVALSFTFALPTVLAVFDLGKVAEPMVTVLSLLVLGMLTIFGLSVIYRYGPCRDPAEWSWVSGGSILSCALWLIASAGFAYYVGNFGSYNESFGALGGVVILLTWIWLSAFIILLGAELNGEMEAQTRKDTTRGDDQPMGTRDAAKADRLGEAAAK